MVNNIDNKSNNNNNFENLFYKVIHNKYLFNKIIQQIHINDWVEYDKIKQIHIDNKKKFKDITSLQWMVQNKQFHLLKCKLEAGETIQIDAFNISQYINLIYNNCSNGGVDNGFGKDLGIEIFKLLLSSESINYKILDSIHNIDQELIKVALNEPFLVQVLPSLLENGFKESNNSQLKLLLDAFYGLNNSNKNTTDNSSLINEYKNKIIKKVFKVPNIFQRDRVLELILSDERYYNNNPQHLTNQLKEEVLLDLEEILFNIISITNQNQLIKLKYYKLSDKLKPYSNDINEVINNNNDNDNSNHIIVINLIKLVNQINNNKQVIKFPFSYLKDLNNLKLFLENNKNDWKELKDSMKTEYFTLDIEYIKYYILLEHQAEYKWFNFESINRGIQGLVYLAFIDKEKTKAKEEFYELFEFFSRNNINSTNKEISIWLEVYKRAKCTSSDGSTILLLKDRETIDLVNTFYFDLKIANTELVEYTIKNKIKSINDFYLGQIYNYSLESATQSLNFNEIKTIFYNINENQKDRPINSINIPKVVKKSDQMSSQEVNQLYDTINHFVQNDIYLGVYYLLDFFLPTTNLEHLISKDKLSLWIRLFIISARKCSKDRIQLFLSSNFNPVIQDSQLFYDIFQISNNEPLLSDIKDNILIFQNDFSGNIFQNQNLLSSNRNPLDIIEIIKLLINYSKQQRSSSKSIKYSIYVGQDNYETLRLGCMDIIINYFFRILIQSQSKDVPLEMISNIYQFINESGIVKVAESTLFSIYYLARKSLKLIKYIFNITRDSSTYQNFLISDYTLLMDGFMIMCLDIINPSLEYKKRFIKPDIFTFEFIHGRSAQSFDQLLLYFVHAFINDSISNKSLEENYESFNNLINRNIFYFLEIRRPDLAIQHLDYIQNHQEIDYSKIQLDLGILNVIFEVNSKELILKVLSSSHLLNQFLNGNDLFLGNNSLLYFNEIKEAIPSFNLSNIAQVLYSSLYENMAMQTHPFLFGNDQDQLEGSNKNMYSISLYKFLLSKYPNNQFLKLSKNAIKKFCRYPFYIKQLYDNQLITDNIDNNNDEYNKLLTYTNELLFNDDNLKYLNWLPK